MKRIILDTNFLLAPGELGINIPAELGRICDFQFQVCVLKGTVDELKKLSEGHSKESINAKIGYKIAKSLDVIKSDGHVDDALVDEAKKDDSIIATQDQDLKRRLKKQKSPHIIIRGKRTLELIVP